MKYISKRRSLPKILAIVGLVCVQLIWQNVAFGDADNAKDEKKVNIAVMHGATKSGGKMWHGEFDYAIKTLGWNVEKFSPAEESLNELTSNLGKFDIVATTPLYNWGNTPDHIVTKDMSPYAEKFRKFIEEGGAFVLTDALDGGPGMFTWLVHIDPLLKYKWAYCKAVRDIENVVPVNTIRTLPNIVRENNSWAHLDPPEGHGWEILAVCDEGAPQVIMKRIGKGFVYLTGCRFGAPEFFENFITCLNLQRMNLVATQFDLPKFSIGNGMIKITLKAMPDQAPTVQSRITITPIDDPQNKKVFTKQFVFEKNKENVLETPYLIDMRGKLRIVYEVADKENTAKIFDKVVLIKDLLNVSGPFYRGFAVESELKKRDGNITSLMEVCPYKEKLQDLLLKLKVIDGDGKLVGEAKESKITQAQFATQLKIGMPKPGSYKIVGELYDKGSLVETKTAELTVLTDAECPVYINDDQNLVADGKEFFALGIYHSVADCRNTTRRRIWCIKEQFAPTTVPALFSKHPLA